MNNPKRPQGKSITDVETLMTVALSLGLLGMDSARELLEDLERSRDLDLDKPASNEGVTTRRLGN